MDRRPSHRLVRELFAAALSAVDPERLVRTHLDGTTTGGGRPPRILAVGKAASAMARAAVAQTSTTGTSAPGTSTPGTSTPGTSAPPPSGLLVTVDQGCAGPTHDALERAGWTLLAAGHPLPDARGEQAARAVERYVTTTSAGECDLLVLLSGGASALLPAPVEGVSLDDKVAITGALLRAGATIWELNAVRKHLSRIKGGGLARRFGEWAGERSCTVLALSDVLDDDPAVIGSGPFSPDRSTFRDALDVLTRHGLLAEASAVTRLLRRGAAGELPETVKPGDPWCERVAFHLLAGNRTAVAAARAEAVVRMDREGHRCQVVAREEPVVGEAREAGARIAREALRRLTTEAPLVVISGGETTVTVRGAGRGGRSQELALGFALAAEELRLCGRDPMQRFTLLSAGTDGRDGPTDAAGAVVDEGTLGRCRAAGCDPRAALAANDAYHALEAAGDLLRWPATETNVADLQILLVEDSERPSEAC